MAVQLFKLRDVPDDEAEDIRQLLDEHEIVCYETVAGGWGVGMPAIWLNDESQYSQAREIIDLYQQQRAATARAEFEALKREGKHYTWFDSLKNHPVQMIVFVLFSLFILYVSLSPFLNFGK